MKKKQKSKYSRFTEKIIWIITNISLHKTALIFSWLFFQINGIIWNFYVRNHKTFLEKCTNLNVNYYPLYIQWSSLLCIISLLFEFDSRYICFLNGVRIFLGSKLFRWWKINFQKLNVKPIWDWSKWNIHIKVKEFDYDEPFRFDHGMQTSYAPDLTPPVFFRNIVYPLQ